MQESDNNSYNCSKHYAFKLSKNGKILDASEEFVEKIGYDPNSILAATIFDLVETPDIDGKLERGGEVSVVGVDGKSYTLYLHNDREFVYAYDTSRFYQIIRSMYAGVWDFYYGLLFVDENKRILTANDTFYEYTGLERIEGRIIDEVFPEVSQLVDKILEKGEGEVFVEVNNRMFQVRVKVREVNVLGKRVYEVLIRSLTEERVRNLRMIFNNLKYPVIAFFADEIIYYNNAAKNLVSEIDFKAIKDKNFGSIKVGGKQYFFFKVVKDNVYVFVEDMNDVLEAIENELLKYKLSFETSADAIIIVDRDGTIVHTNPAVKLHGYSPEDLIGRNILEFIQSNQLDDVKRAMEEGSKGKFKRMEIRIKDKWGNLRWVEVVGVPVKDPSGEITGGILFLRDITTRKELQRKLVEREELYRTLSEKSHTGIFIIQNDKIVYGNEKLREILGYTVEETNSLEHPYEVLHPEFYELALERYIAREGGEETPEGYDVKVITKDGKEKWLKILASRISYKGEPAVMVNVADITDLKEREMMLKRLNILLRVTSECSREISHEKTEFKIFTTVKKHLEKAGLKVAVYVYEDGLILAGISKGLDEGECEKIAAKYIQFDEIRLEKVGDSDAVIMPISNGVISGIMLVFSDSGFTEEEVSILASISRDISYALKSLKAEREKEAALRVIMENLSHFENLADRLRNPLAVIKGYLEVRENFSYDDFARKIEEHANKIEKILDELRAREIVTYEMKKILES